MLRTLAVATLVWLAASCPAAWAETIQGRVVSVHDGDTMQVELPGGRREKIRLLGIDSPEIGQPPWGERARDYTRGLALDKDVRVETDVQPRDKYGRLLGYVYAGTTFVNLEVIRGGHAVLLTYPPNVKFVELFTKAQEEARTKGLGLWDPKAPLPETPYQFRHKNDGNRTYDRGDGMRIASPRPRASFAPPSQVAPKTMVRFNKRSKKIHPPGCGHECPTCLEMTMEEAQKRGGVLCKHR